LKFPDLDVFLAALASGAVPAAVSQAPASAGVDDQGQLWVETSARLPQAAQNELKKLGVQSVRSTGAAVTAPGSCWAELLPLVPATSPFDRAEAARPRPGKDRSAGPPAAPEQTPVLFELPSGEAMVRLATEVLRLGNDRQGFRWL